MVIANGFTEDLAIEELGEIAFIGPEVGELHSFEVDAPGRAITRFNRWPSNSAVNEDWITWTHHRLDVMDRVLMHQGILPGPPPLRASGVEKIIKLDVH